MKKLTLQEFYNEMELAHAVIVDDDGLCYPSLWLRDGDDDGEIAVHMSWSDHEGQEYRCDIFAEEQEVKFDGVSFYLKDDCDSDTKITPLYPKSS